jgi:hypothetical protein
MHGNLMVCLKSRYYSIPMKKEEIFSRGRLSVKMRRIRIVLDECPGEAYSSLLSHLQRCIDLARRGKGAFFFEHLADSGLLAPAGFL